MASFNELINQKVPVLVDFKEDWCGSYKTMIPISKDIKQQLKEIILTPKI